MLRQTGNDQDLVAENWLNSTVFFRASPLSVFKPVCMPQALQAVVVEHLADFLGLQAVVAGAISTAW